MPSIQVPYFAFRDYPAGINQQVEEALLGALRSQQYILGEEVRAFENEFAAYVQAGIAIGVGNGYDALVVALKAAGIGAGDEVIVPTNTFIATVNAVVQVGAIPVLAEPDRYTCNLTAIEASEHITPRTKAIIPVHLYGQACEMTGFLRLAEQHNLTIIEDFAQAQGASYKGRPVGSFGHISPTSFYPTKNLGALGDGGAVVTSDPELAAYAHMYHNYGQQQKYHNQLIGINSRLDTLQAAALRVKLQHLDALNGERQRLAQVYLTALQGIGDLVMPVTAPDCTHVYHIFNIRTKQRDALQLYLTEQGIQTAIHYPVPVHLQVAYTYLGYEKGSFPVAEELADTSLSLPLFPGMTEAEQEAVVTCIHTFFERHG
ncbi:DegT/DnrJ/EryC1/StrS aminotransferase family protein [Pontibacter sp. HSC-36F09]|uniref:DegT/DnrJ/EryC1/StrS family aminotransferase n=1 Tax=Pontibacter sp. HSC-36F09 TaxID=2910966 RepID=UPI00209DFEAA|nr:DegT/DnrJ/EryC1/StrS family aminotransferase [Pontibacter sp. HSC-36F09]MCP2042187.1 dTDP-4-amino-4,6-dideoxygalactose transaminase [Pontibacter sp. HSC-36F09]